MGNRVVSFLRRTYPTKTAVHVAADIGVKVNTVEKWLERTNTPSGFWMARLFCAYGPDFICAVVDNPPAWLDAQKRAARQIELRASIERQRVELERLQAVQL